MKSLHTRRVNHIQLALMVLRFRATFSLLLAFLQIHPPLVAVVVLSGKIHLHLAGAADSPAGGLHRAGEAAEGRPGCGKMEGFTIPPEIAAMGGAGFSALVLSVVVKPIVDRCFTAMEHSRQTLNEQVVEALRAVDATTKALIQVLSEVREQLRNLSNK
jgi:hypothetical protein